MKKPKRKYKVFYQRRMDSELPENCTIHDKVFAGETFAVSEAQAINNVRHRVIGDISQYLPLVSDGRYELFYDWSAELCI